jgi:hypothetical protein
MVFGVINNCASAPKSGSTRYFDELQPPVPQTTPAMRPMID